MRADVKHKSCSLQDIHWQFVVVVGGIAALWCVHCRQLPVLVPPFLPIFVYAKIVIISVLCVWLFVYGLTFFDGSEFKPRILPEIGWFGEGGFGAYWLGRTHSSLLFEDRDAIETVLIARAGKTRIGGTQALGQRLTSDATFQTGRDGIIASQALSASESPGSASTTDSSFHRLTHQVLPPQGSQQFRDHCLQSGKQVIFAIHPHGIASIAHAYVASCCLGLGELWHPLTIRGLAARAMFQIPIIRDIWLKENLVDAGRSTAVRCLQEGFSLSISPGGEREMMLAEPGREVVVLKSRKGFAKLAIQHNLPVIPVYGFGENSTFENPKFLWWFRSWLQKRTGIALTFSYSWRRYNWFGKQFWLPLLWTSYLDRQITIAIGKPVLPQRLATSLAIDVSEENLSHVDCLSNCESSSAPIPQGAECSKTLSNPTDNPPGSAGKPRQWNEITDDEVDEFHGRYVKALVNLFDHFKSQCGYGDVLLEVI